MSRAIGKHLNTIREQRLVLDDYKDFAPDIDAFLFVMSQVNGTTHYASAHAIIQRYKQNLDIAEKRLKVAAAIGAVVDISEVAVGHDIRCVAEPAKTGASLGNQQRARDNLLALDFFDRTYRMPGEGCHASKLTIPVFEAPISGASIDSIANAFLRPSYTTVVLASFQDKADAMIYRLAVQ